MLAVPQLKPWRTRGVSNHQAFMGNWPIIIYTFLALSAQWMSSPSGKWERGVSPRFHVVVFVFGVPKSRELGNRGSPRFPTPMVESFSADPLPAIESYLTESHLEFCQTSTTGLLCESKWNAFRWLGWWWLCWWSSSRVVNWF